MESTSKKSRPKLELSAAEVESVIHYVYQHVRCSEPSRDSPKGGAGWRVWAKMFEFLEDVHEAPAAPVKEEPNMIPLFDIK